MENGGGSAYEPFGRDGPIGTATRPAPDASQVSTAGLAQLVEHVICNHGVGGSNPSAGTNKTLYFQQLNSQPKAAAVLSSGCGDTPGTQKQTATPCGALAVGCRFDSYTGCKPRKTTPLYLVTARQSCGMGHEARSRCARQCSENRDRCETTLDSVDRCPREKLGRCARIEGLPRTHRRARRYKTQIKQATPDEAAVRKVLRDMLALIDHGGKDFEEASRVVRHFLTRPFTVLPAEK
jgi:hypothetical protein